MRIEEKDNLDMDSGENKKIILYISEEDRNLYNEIKNKNGDLKGTSNSDIFLMAMSYGYYFDNKKKSSLDKKKDYVRVEYISDEQKQIISSLVIGDIGKMEILSNMDDVYSIAEEYANNGIKLFHKFYFENEHNFIERAEEKLREVYEDQGIGERSASE